MSHSYEVVTDQVTVDTLAIGGAVQEFRVPAPAGKTPISGGYVDSLPDSSFGDYPDGDDWVFRFFGRSTARSADLYVVCAVVCP